MEDPVFKISPKRYTGESVVISMRLPKDMLAELDGAAARTGRARNELLTMSLEFALSHMEIEENK